MLQLSVFNFILDIDLALHVFLSSLHVHLHPDYHLVRALQLLHSVYFVRTLLVLLMFANLYQFLFFFDLLHSSSLCYLFFFLLLKLYQPLIKGVQIRLTTVDIGLVVKLLVLLSLFLRVVRLPLYLILISNDRGLVHLFRLD